MTSVGSRARVPPMIRSILSLSALVGALLLCGCTQPPERHVPSSNVAIPVDVLLSVDGITVYRFMDDGHYVYLASRPGSVTSWEQSQGKSRYPMSVATVR